MCPPGKEYRNRLLLHDLILRDSCRCIKTALHRIGSRARVHVLDKGDAKGTATILVSREFGYAS